MLFSGIYKALLVHGSRLSRRSYSKLHFMQWLETFSNFCRFLLEKQLEFETALSVPPRYSLEAADKSTGVALAGSSLGLPPRPIWGFLLRIQRV
jgi:hypothetical protein